MSKKVIIRFR